MKQRLIGREAEMAELRRCLESDRSEFVIVYGRRRVGKTFLVDCFFDGIYDFSFVGRNNVSKENQLRAFAKALKKSAGLERQPKFKDWTEAFDALEDFLESLEENRKKVVFIDEMPWIDTPQSEFVEALEGFWNAWGARRQDILFVASGSASSWMMDKLVENPGGLHARITNNIYVRPFTLKETETYLHSRGMNWDRYQILQLYMTMGGIPFYLSLLDPGKSLVHNINHLFFRKNSEMRTEFQELYSAIFSNAGKYLEVVNILFGHKEGMTYAQIQKASGIEGARLTTLLKNLERCDFAISYSQFGNKTKGVIYRLVDFYTLFYLKFIASADSKDEEWWFHNFNSRSVEAWQGTAFELICLTHLPQIRQRLGISGISTAASSWRFTPGRTSAPDERGAQIDLVIDRADHVINLCEMKFSVGIFTISADYENKVRSRIQLFKEKTKTRKALVSTFITTYGVSNSDSCGVVEAEVKADDLFA
ncbi:MAG: ATP-binding protein [Alloprevotella sp.]